MNKDEHIKELEQLLKRSMAQTDHAIQIAKNTQELIDSLLTKVESLKETP